MQKVHGMPKLMYIAKSFIGECWHAGFNPDCILEFLSDNCLHQKTIGKCIGADSFKSDCYDWAQAFPDYSTHIKSIKEHRNVVVCDIDRLGTHMSCYRSSNPDKNSILTTSNFFLEIENVQATGRRYQQPAKLIFAFEKDKISQVIIDEDPTGLPLQLGLNTSRSSERIGKLSNLQFTRDAVNRALGVDLSLREVHCFALAFCGLSAKHIAELLGLSFRTIETHFCHVYQKLGCYGKQHAWDLMYEKQLVTLWLDLGKFLLMGV